MRVRSVLAVVLALLFVQAATLVWPAYACGCGGMVVDGQEDIFVEQETSVVRWDGAREDIVMRLTVGGDASEAAWIMPVPSRAEVELGDELLFDQLYDVTRPEQRERTYFWPRDGDWPFTSSSGDGDGAGGAAPGVDAAAPPVDVVGRDRLGPFDVARLTATDPAALEGWLEENGFALPDDLAEGLRPYVEQEWEYVAIRLAPAGDGEENPENPEELVLGGTLDPLHLSFDAEEPVYPMRLSRLAEVDQALKLYVLAPHRMEPAGAIGGSPPEVGYAARLDAAGAGEGPGDGPLRDLAGDDAFLTVLEQEFPEPARINGDHVLRRAAEDTEEIPVVYTDRLLTWAGVPAWIVTVTGGLGLGAVAAWQLTRRNAARRRLDRLVGVHRAAP